AFFCFTILARFQPRQFSSPSWDGASWETGPSSRKTTTWTGSSYDRTRAAGGFAEIKGGSMRVLSGASLTLGILGLAATIGCAQVGMVQARRDFKAANAAYQQQDYKKAADLYEATLKEDPSLSQAYFYLANSYD